MKITDVEIITQGQLCLLAPGTLPHRLYFCTHPALVAARDKWLPLLLQEEAKRECLAGNATQWSKALFPPPAAQATPQRHELFEWIIRPAEGVVLSPSCTAYPDGSRLGPNDGVSDAYGWAFAI